MILKVWTFCPAPYCWVLLERTFFFLASSSSFLRCSSSSLRSFSSCRVHRRVTLGERSHLCSHLKVCGNSQRAWPASPSLSPPGLFAAPLSQHDVSPGHSSIVHLSTLWISSVVRIYPLQFNNSGIQNKSTNLSLVNNENMTVFTGIKWL